MDQQSPGLTAIILTTTPGIDGRQVQEYLEVVSSDAVYEPNTFGAMFDTGKSNASARMDALQAMRASCLQDLRACAADFGADAVIGISFSQSDVELTEVHRTFLTVTGTAVKLTPHLSAARHEARG